MDTSEHIKLLQKLRRKRRTARFILTLENLVHCFWRPAVWVMLFAALWLLQPYEMAGRGASIVLAVIFWAGFIWLAYKDMRHMHIASVQQADKALEESAGLAHRPIRSLEDRLANADLPETQLLWNQYKQTNLSLITRLRQPKPKPYFSTADHYALRIAVILLFVVSVAMAGTDWKRDLSYGLFPEGAPDAKIPITLWITPPDYTGHEVMVMDGESKPDDTITVPEGSIIKARLDSRFIKPSLHMGEKVLPFTKTGPKSWEIEAEITDTENITIKQFFVSRFDISVRYKKDLPPTVKLLEENPKILPKGAIQLPLSVMDDYGVTNLSMTMKLDPVVEQQPLGNIVHEERPVSSIPEQETELTPYYDLTWHPWAGLPVEMEITVTDETGQQAVLEPIKLVLPERTFEHPVAKILIEQRQKLSWAPLESARDVAIDLEQILAYPDQYQHDRIVFLSLRTMASRLHYDPSLDNIKGIISQLWDTALRIEDGNLGMASRKLREAQQNMQSLLNDENATDEQIAKAMKELRQAMAEYFQELGREMQKRLAEGKPIPMAPLDMMKNLNPEDLAAFLDQLQSESMSGDKSAAMEMLSRLEDMMNTIDPSMSMQMPPEMEFMEEGVSELQQLIDEQKALRDQTQRQADLIENKRPQTYGEIIPLDDAMPDLLGNFDLPQPQENFEVPEIERPDIDTQAHKVEQDALRYILGQLMLEADKKLNEIPENMQKAEKEMRMSAKQLSENYPELSLPHQEQAIKYLEEAQQQMQQQLMAMMQQMQMMSFGPGQTDPFGRPIQRGDGPSWLSDDKVRVPDESQRKEAQEILRELRERSGDRTRPDYELDYYNRLMDRF